MPRAVRMLFVIVAIAGLLALPAGAEESAGCTDPLTNELVLTEQATWIHQAETKAGNLGALGATGLPSWNTTAPTASVQSGAGGGYLAVFPGSVDASQAENTGLTVQGSFAGCVDTMLLDLYAAMPTNRTGTAGTLDERALTGVVGLTVDGEKIINGGVIDFKTVPNPGGQATYLLRLAITELHAALADYGLDPAAEHTIRLNVVPQKANTGNTVFVYDTTEVPAGITFNGTVSENYSLLPAF